MRIALLVSILMLLLGGRSLEAQPTPSPAVQTVKWQTLTSKDEFSIAMPDGSKGYTEDDDYYVGKARHQVTKRIFVFRSINGTVLIMELLEGDASGVKQELISRITQGRTPYKLLKEQAFDGVTVNLYHRQEDKLVSFQQFVLFKKGLYVIQGHAGDEKDPILQQYLRSLSVVAGGKAVMPNLSAGDDVKLAAKPHDIALLPAISPDDEPLKGKPDREIIFLYRPRPRYTTDARRAGLSGAVMLNVLFSASGSIKKIEVESGDMALRESAIAAAEKILFIPAEKDGKPVSVWKKVSYNFATY